MTLIELVNKLIDQIVEMKQRISRQDAMLMKLEVRLIQLEDEHENKTRG